MGIGMKQYIKAMIKTQAQIEEIYPEAACWGKGSGFRSADEVVLPYLGKSVWLRKVRTEICWFHFVIKGTEIIIEPKWIAYFDTDDFVIAHDWKFEDQCGGVTNDIWFDFYEDRFVMISDLLVVTG